MTTQTTAPQCMSNLRHQYLTGHRILLMIVAGVGLSLALPGPPAWGEPYCPLPAVNPWCAPRQPFDCFVTAANETCLPREIRFPSPGATPEILLCDCFSDVPGCGPVDIKPNPIPPGGYTVSCPGPCPPGQVCELHFNGISQGVSSIDSSQIPPGAIVSCGCEVPPPPPVCPLGNSWCAGLQLIDCTTTGAVETCLPREVTVDPSGTGQPIVRVCDCFSDVAACGPVSITPNVIDYTISCPGSCPIPQTCYLHFDGVSQGVSSIGSSQILPGTAVTCACAELGPALCPPAVSECIALQSRDCLDTTGQCLPKVIRHNLPPALSFFPPEGTDLLTSTTGHVEVISPLGEPMMYYIRESPPNTTEVIRESPADVGGHREIEMELVAMELVGVGGGGGGGGGAVQIRESPTRASHGRVVGAENTETDYPADSFFDLFVEIDIPDLEVHGLYNMAPIHLDAHGITAVPPLGSSFKTPPGWLGVELYDAYGYPTGYVIREVEHNPPPPAGTPEWEVIQCACMNPGDCHVTRELSADPTCVGGCPEPPPTQVCTEFITTGQDFVDYTCECAGPVRDHVVCEPQDVGNTHPNVYWYDVTTSWVTCDFHVLVLDPTLANYTNGTIIPWPGDTWVFSVHQVGTETWASWGTPDCAEPINAPATHRFQFNHNGLSDWSGWRTTYKGDNNPYDPYTIDMSQNHAAEPDGYGYRVHVPQPPLEACCFADGHCEMRVAADCLLIDGTPKGPGTLCLGDNSGNGIDDACEILDKVVCQPQGGLNPSHPSTYWYDVTPSGFGRCDFHVRVYDPNPGDYANWSMNPYPWPAGSWAFLVHQVGAEWWASWWDTDPNCSHAFFVKTRFQFDNSNASTWGDWTTTISNTSDPYDDIVDRSANHPAEQDGYGYRVHVPLPPGAATQACCLPKGTCVDVEYNKCVALGGDPQGPGTTCMSPSVVCMPLKWVQPPTYNVAGPGGQCFWGWNEHSHYQSPGCAIVADDWACSTNQPITDIHWWGSYQEWTTQSPPPFGPGFPDLFHIGIWTDVPVAPPSGETCCYCWNPPMVLPPTTCSPNPRDQAECDLWGGGQYQQCTYFADSRCMGDHCETIQPLPYSHPGKMIWESIVPRMQLNERYVGCDEYPGQPLDTCFRYDFDIPESQWFYQAPSTDPTIYWISISAFYMGPPAQPFIWGWKTREHFFNDDAVRIFAPNPPTIGSEFIEGTPIETPDGESWDMAFVLTSASPGASKWDQWPNPDLPGLHAHDGITLADNWECQGGMVTDFHWWGNYELDQFGNEIRGDGIQCINISIHRNRPDVPWCVPQDPELWGVCAPFDALHERDTGLVNSEGSKIYLYDFYFGPGFEQVQGEIYWLNLEAFPVNAANPALWRWQENSRDETPRLCPAAERTLSQAWHTIVWGMPPLFRYSEMAFRVTSTPYPPGPDPSGIAKNRYLTMVVPPVPTPPEPLTALRVTLVDLQHPIPANVPQNPPKNFTTFDTRVNGVCVGGSYAGHHCDTDADCRLCAGGSNAGRVCTVLADCPGGSCPAGGTCSSLAACTAAGEMNGCARWVGNPGTFLEAQDFPLGANFRGARLQCTPYYDDWGSEGVFHVTGAEIVPSSTYEVVSFAANCAGNEDTCADVSLPLRLETVRWGDIAFPWNPPVLSTQPDGLDVTGLVNKFKNVLGAPIKPIAQLQTNLPELNADINALDIVACVNAFKGFAYSFGGPCPCPSLVVCGATACPEGGDKCTGSGLPGLGAESMCVKTCTGGDNPGAPCINDGHCKGTPPTPNGICGNPFCRDRCGRCTPP